MFMNKRGGHYLRKRITHLSHRIEVRILPLPRQNKERMGGLGF